MTAEQERAEKARVEAINLQQLARERNAQIEAYNESLRQQQRQVDSEIRSEYNYQQANRTRSFDGGGLSMPSPPQPSVITSCDAGGCWDNMGGRYNKGAGTTYFPSTGGSCQMVGGMMQCP